MEIILDQPRRRWSEDAKRALVAVTCVGGQTVNGVVRGITSVEACYLAGVNNIEFARSLLFRFGGANSQSLVTP